MIDLQSEINRTQRKQSAFVRAYMKAGLYQDIATKFRNEISRLRSDFQVKLLCPAYLPLDVHPSNLDHEYDGLATPNVKVAETTR